MILILQKVVCVSTEFLLWIDILDNYLLNSKYWCDLCVISPLFVIHSTANYFEYIIYIINLASLNDKSACEKYLIKKIGNRDEMSHKI